MAALSAATTVCRAIATALTTSKEARSSDQSELCECFEHGEKLLEVIAND
jgi:hypothetical protein